MILRSTLLALVFIPALAQAASKTDGKFEYLLPEDWKESDAAPSQPQAGLALTAKTFLSGMKKHIGDDKDCKGAKFTTQHSLKKGSVVFQEIEISGAKIDVFLDIGSKGLVKNARFQSPVKDQDHLVTMLCATYGLMRTIEPNYLSAEAVKKDTLHLWQEAQAKPFTKAFMSNTFKAQMTPFELNAY